MFFIILCFKCASFGIGSIGILILAIKLYEEFRNFFKILIKHFRKKLRPNPTEAIN